MSDNAFTGKTAAPTEADLVTAMGSAKPVWDQLLSEFGAELGMKHSEWSSYSPKAGWSLRVKRGTRTIVWMGPRQGSFVAAFILGPKAMQAARVTKLPERIVRIVSEAPKYPEGFGVRIETNSSEDVAAIKTLAGIKIEN